MHRLNRILAIVVVSSWAALAGAVHAQVVDPAIAGFWTARSTGGHLSLELSPDGSFIGAVLAANVNCIFRGAVGAREASVSSAGEFKATSRATLQCVGGRPAGSTDVKFDATRASLRIDILGFSGQLTRSARLLGAAGNRIVSPGIPGHWEGTSAEVHASLDLAADGSFAGTVSGPGLQGCTFKARIAPAQAFDNDADSFNGLALGSMSGCADATLNKSYLAFLGATPDEMSFSFIRLDNERELFALEGMTRTAGVALTGGAREAKAGMWNSPLGSGWGMSLVTGKTAARTPFVVLYVYNTDKSPTWYVMSSGVWKDDNNFEGDLYATTGTDWRAPSFDSSSVTVKKVGTLLMTFTSDTVGRLTYQIKEGSATYVSSSPMVKQEF
jgi:hypothetical protein